VGAADPRPIDERLRDAGLPALPRLAWLEVDLSGITANARALRSMLPPAAQLATVVKGDAYGHGLLPVAHASLAGGAGFLCVATLDEALLLRAGGFEARILVLYSVPPSGVDDAIEADLDVVVMDATSAAAVAEAVGRRGGTREIRVHLGVDTGMARGGLPPSEAIPTARRLLAAGLSNLAGTWSHLASPEDRDATARQVEAFRAVLADLERAGVDPGLRHLVASGGILDDVSPPWDLARVGLALYGYLPEDVRVAPARQAAAAMIRPALRLRAIATAVESIPAGTAVGYGGTWRAERPSRIATLPVGYADGWTRLYAGESTARVRGRDVPLVGRVSSDAVAADVTDVEGFEPGDELTLLAPAGEGGSTVQELARRRDSIPWEVVYDFSPRLSRVFVQDGAIIAVRYLDGQLATVSGFSLRRAALGDVGRAAPGRARS